MQELEQENTQEQGIPPALIMAVEEVGKELACQELPIVEKYLQKVHDNLGDKHPIKQWVLNWLIGEIPKAESVLGCPVPYKAPQ